MWTLNPGSKTLSCICIYYYEYFLYVENSNLLNSLTTHIEGVSANTFLNSVKLNRSV